MTIQEPRKCYSDLWLTISTSVCHQRGKEDTSKAMFISMLISLVGESGPCLNFVFGTRRDLTYQGLPFCGTLQAVPYSQYCHAWMSLKYQMKSVCQKEQREVNTIDHFRVPMCLCFKASLSWVRNQSHENDWFAWKWNCTQNWFSCERFRTETRFETGTRDLVNGLFTLWLHVAVHLFTDSIVQNILHPK